MMRALGYTARLRQSTYSHTSSVSSHSRSSASHRWTGSLACFLPGLMHRGRGHGIPTPHPAIGDASCVCTGYRRTEEHVLGPGIVFSASQHSTPSGRSLWDWLHVTIPPHRAINHGDNNTSTTQAASIPSTLSATTIIHPRTRELVSRSELCFDNTDDIDSFLLAQRAYDIEQGIEISPAQLQITEQPSTSMAQRSRQRASHGFRTIYASSPEPHNCNSVSIDVSHAGTPKNATDIKRNTSHTSADPQWNSLTATRVSAVVAAAASDINWASGRLNKTSITNMGTQLSGCSLSDNTIIGSNTSLSSPDQFCGNSQTVISHSTPTDTVGMPGPGTMSSVHTQVDYIHCFAPDMQQVNACSFYWGVMDRYEAERLLDNKHEGTFLLRDSAQEEYMFSVSFRRYGRSLHARVEQWNHRFSFDSHDPGVYSSPTICGLVKHYNDPGCCMFFEPMLTLPLPRTFTFSLQQLCRSVISAHTTYDGVSALPLPPSLKDYLKVYHYKQKVRVRTFDS